MRVNDSVTFLYYSEWIIYIFPFHENIAEAVYSSAAKSSNRTSYKFQYP